MSPIDWQTQSTYDAVQHHDAPGFAWEFLRRNSDFKADLKALQASGRQLPTDAQKEGFARKWGVRCRTS